MFVAASFFLLTITSGALCNGGGWKKFWNGGKGGGGGGRGRKLLKVSFKRLPIFGSGRCPVSFGKSKLDGDGGGGKK